MRAGSETTWRDPATDFAVSDLPFQGVDRVTGQDDSALGSPYAHLPLAAGGVSFPYHHLVNGQLVRELRLSGQTLAKIFSRDHRRDSTYTIRFNPAGTYTGSLTVQILAVPVDATTTMTIGVRPRR
jgi:ABC-type phosphate transport system substrate-binding protein